MIQTATKTLTVESEVDLPRVTGDLVRAAISRHLKRDDWTPEDVVRHVRCGLDAKSGLQSYSFGDSLILEIYPPESETKRKKTVWNVRYREIL